MILNNNEIISAMPSNALFILTLATAKGLSGLTTDPAEFDSQSDTPFEDTPYLSWLTSDQPPTVSIELRKFAIKNQSLSAKSISQIPNSPEIILETLSCMNLSIRKPYA